MESNIAIKHNETYQRINDINTKIDQNDKSIKNLFEITNNHANNLVEVEKAITETNSNIILAKSEFKENLNRQWKDTLELTENINKKLNEIKEKTEQSMQQSQSNTNRINVIENIQDNISRLSTNNDIEIKNLWKDKIDKENYNNEMNRINNQFRSAAFAIETVENNLKLTDKYIDRQMPFKIQ